jgi:hypothetical protein
VNSGIVEYCQELVNADWFLLVVTAIDVLGVSLVTVVTLAAGVLHADVNC